MKSEKVILLFPDGVAIKNYLYTKTFGHVKDKILLWHWFDKETETTVSNYTGISEVQKLPPYNESLKAKFLRELICLSRLKFNAEKTDNKTILSNWNDHHKGFKFLFYKLIEVTSLLVYSYETILKLEDFYEKTIRKSPYYSEVLKSLQSAKPNKIFCGHQRAIQCATIFAAATDLGIETITVIYSWDNLPKARMSVKADKYLVWSDYMKEEMHLYYPEIGSEKIEVTGTPQFEFYQNPKNIIAKDIFYKTYNLDADKKIICYSGDDEKTSPDDPQYLHDLVDELMKNGLDKEYQVLLRKCPVDYSGRFQKIVEQFPNIIKIADPIWNAKNASSWTTIYPMPEDISLLVSTVYYSDVVVNLGSTMVFDFAMFEKPCVYINYDQRVKVNPNWSTKTIYKYQHFRSMPQENAVSWWNYKEDISNILSNIKFNRVTKTWQEIVLGKTNNASVNIKKILY